MKKNDEKPIKESVTRETAGMYDDGNIEEMLYSLGEDLVAVGDYDTLEFDGLKGDTLYFQADGAFLDFFSEENLANDVESLLNGHGSSVDYTVVNCYYKQFTVNANDTLVTITFA